MKLMSRTQKLLWDEEGEGEGETLMDSLVLWMCVNVLGKWKALSPYIARLKFSLFIPKFQTNFTNWCSLNLWISYTVHNGKKDKSPLASVKLIQKCDLPPTDKRTNKRDIDQPETDHRLGLRLWWWLCLRRWRLDDNHPWLSLFFSRRMGNSYIPTLILLSWFWQPRPGFLDSGNPKNQELVLILTRDGNGPRRGEFLKTKTRPAPKMGRLAPWPLRGQGKIGHVTARLIKYFNII